MGFQKGDQRVFLGEKSFRLRLTIGSLAEINSRLGCSGPRELSDQLRTLTAAQARVLLACVMRPCLPVDSSGGQDADMSAALFSKADIAAAMAAICALFEEAFSDGE